MLINREPKMAVQNPWTSNPGITPDAIFNISALITKVNIPRVSTFIGSVKTSAMGLKMAFKMPSKAAAKNAEKKL